MFFIPKWFDFCHGNFYADVNFENHANYQHLSRWYVDYQQNKEVNLNYLIIIMIFSEGCKCCIYGYRIVFRGSIKSLNALNFQQLKVFWKYFTSHAIAMTFFLSLRWNPTHCWIFCFKRMASKSRMILMYCNYRIITFSRSCSLTRSSYAADFFLMMEFFKIKTWLWSSLDEDHQCEFMKGA